MVFTCDYRSCTVQLSEPSYVFTRYEENSRSRQTKRFCCFFHAKLAIQDLYETSTEKRNREMG